MDSRTENTKRNIFASYLLMIVQIIFTFFSRTIIVHELGSDYLGISSLFSSVLTVLNIAELGFTSSIVYFMYEPLAHGDTTQVCSLLCELNKIYKIVGSVILGSGLIITPLIPKLVNGATPKEMNIYILYVLYLVNTCISYFLFAHKTALLTAAQRLDLTKWVSCVVVFAQYGLQLIALLYFHNYYLFVLSMILGTAATNLFTAYISNKRFPEYICKGELDKTIKKEIMNKVKGLLICNISAVTYTSLDSIIISKFLGLTSVAIYNNYIAIYTQIASIIATIRNAMQSSVGNMVASESKEKNLKDMELWQFLFSILATWCASCLMCLYQPFMSIWMGNNLLLPMIDVVLIVIWFMVSTVQHAFYLYLAADGLWNEMKWAYIFSTVFNLAMNIVLGKMIGITGIILASLLATFISGTMWQCIILFKHYYKIPAKKYIVEQGKYFLKAFIIIFITYNLCNFVNYTGFINFIFKGLICVVLTTMLIFCFYCRSPYFTRSKNLALKALNKEGKSSV